MHMCDMYVKALGTSHTQHASHAWAMRGPWKQMDKLDNEGVDLKEGDHNIVHA